MLLYFDLLRGRGVFFCCIDFWVDLFCSSIEGVLVGFIIIFFCGGDVMSLREGLSVFGLYLIMLATCAFYTELMVWGAESLVVLSGESIFKVRCVVFVVLVFLSFRYCEPRLRKIW